MLQQILTNFSEDELLDILPKEAINFAISVGSDNDEISKEKVAMVVASTKQVDFIFNDKLRCKIIERLKPELFVALFPEFKLVPQEVKAEHYDAAISWSSENLLRFSAKMGLQDIYETETSNDSTVEGITRIEPNYSLYPYQQKISQDVLSALDATPNSRVLVHLPTGSGKTRTAMNIAAEHLRANDKNVVLWLADREVFWSNET